MKWHTHRLIGVSVAIFSGAGIAAAGISYVGSTLPDVLEGKPPREGAWFFKSRMGSWRRNHRGVSHWFGWYLLLILATYPYSNHLFAWLGIGALTHLAADALTPMGVPLYPFSKSKMMSLKLFATGSLYETIMFIALFASLSLFVSKHYSALHFL